MRSMAGLAAAILLAASATSFAAERDPGRFDSNHANRSHENHGESFHGEAHRFEGHGEFAGRGYGHSFGGNAFGFGFGLGIAPYGYGYNYGDSCWRWTRDYYGRSVRRNVCDDDDDE